MTNRTTLIQGRLRRMAGTAVAATALATAVGVLAVPGPDDPARHQTSSEAPAEVADRPVAVVVDGRAELVRVPVVSRSALRRHLADAHPGAQVTVPAPATEDRIVVETPSTLTVLAAGLGPVQVATTVDQPAAVARAAGVRLDRNDLVRVHPGRGNGRGHGWGRGPHQPPGQLKDGDVIRVVDVDVDTRLVRRTTRPGVRRVRDTDLQRGTRLVTDTGRRGLRVVAVTTVRHDGRVVDVRRRTVKNRPAQPRVVSIGTAVSVAPTPPATRARDTDRGPWPVVAGGAEHRNWRALAACESSGNPRAVNPTGRYHGLYQFDVPTWETVGGTGLPSRASAAEQTYRAKLLYSRRGAQPWPHCGRYL